MTPRAFAFLLGIFLVLLLALRGCDQELRIGTYNIRRFGTEATDLPRLTEIVSESGADVLAVQEIESAAALQDLAKRLSTRGRSFVSVLSQCGGKGEMRVGFLYDENRARLLHTQEFPELDPSGKGSCSSGERPGLAATFAPTRGGPTFTLLNVHFVAGGASDRALRRREQWRLAHVVAKALEAKGLGPVAILGDTNSTGFLDDRGGERTFIESAAESANMDVLTRDLACSEYFGPITEGGALVPSLLDHIVASRGAWGFARTSSVRVHGHCAELRCAPPRDVPTDHATVSDHCPVTVRLAR